MTDLTGYDKVKKIIRERPYDLLQNDVYECVANICRVLQAYKRNKGVRGWSSNILTEDGRKAFSYTEQKQIEEGFAKAKNWLDLILFEGEKEHQGGAQRDTQRDTQKGGGIPDLSSKGSLLVKDIESTGFDISLDKTFTSFLEKTKEQDDFWKRFAYESPGFARLLNTDLPGPYGIPIPLRPLAQLLITFIDSIRLSLSLTGNKSVLLTLLVMVEELVTGQWRQFLMTAAGLFSPTGTAIGVVCKYLINAWMLINPNIRTDILTDIFKGGKSLMIGFLLWCVSTLPPQIVKMPLEQGIERVRQMVSGFDDKLQSLEEKGSEGLKPFGLQLKFRGFNMDAITKISLQDIQNIQALAQWELLSCSKEYQELVDGLAQEPIFGLILELLNVPMSKDDRFRLCGTSTPQTIPERVAKGFEMQITPIENTPASAPIPPTPSSAPLKQEQKGGSRTEKTLKKSKPIKPFFRKTRRKQKVKEFI